MCIGNSYIGVGTNTQYYIFFGGVYNDITPIVDTNVLTNPFTTVSGSTTVTVTDAGYNPSVGDYINFSGASTVGGLLIDGEYSVTAVLSGTTYTITAIAAASSSATGGGTVTAEYEYPVGLNVYSIGTGWGAGPWSGVPTPITFTLGTNPFATTSGSGTITVTQNAHGMVNGTYVAFSGASAVANISAAVLNTTYVISGVTTNTYNINLATLS